MPLIRRERDHHRLCPSLEGEGAVVSVALGVVASELAAALAVAGGVLCGVAAAVSLEVTVFVAVAVVASGAVAVGTLVMLTEGVDGCEGDGR